MIQPVHEIARDRATGETKLVRINPTRIYIGGALGAVSRITVQNGEFFDLGGNPIPEGEVPEEIKADLARNPITAGNLGGPEITKKCAICNETMNATQLEEHLVAHVRNLTDGNAKAASAGDGGAKQAVAEKPTEKVAEKPATSAPAPTAKAA